MVEKGNVEIGFIDVIDEEFDNDEPDSGRDNDEHVDNNLIYSFGSQGWKLNK